MSHDVFICYSSRDKPVADGVCAVLEAEGVRCWIAPRDILPGADWGESIIDAIAAAHAMVLIFSSNANAAQSQIKREVERAVNKGIPVIPFRIENVMPTKSLEYFLSTPHWLDAFNPPLDEHIRQLADSIKRLLGKQVAARPPLLFVQPPSMPPLPGSHKPHKIDLKEIHIGGVPIQEWIKKPKHAAIVGLIALIMIGALWYHFRPTATPEDQQAWNQAAMQDIIPAYQLYMRETPDGYYARKAQDRVDEIKAEASDAFTKAKQTNTQQAYANYVQTYSRQGLDMTAAQEAYQALNAQENNVRNAYRQATSSRSRNAYQTFLSSYGKSDYAADVRQRLATCHNETRNNGTAQTSELQESASATAADPTSACNDARSDASNRAAQTCTAGRGQPGGMRVASQQVGAAPAAPDVGRAAGQLLGGALFGANRGYNYNNNNVSGYKCSVIVQESCSHTTTSMSSVEVCQ